MNTLTKEKLAILTVVILFIAFLVLLVLGVIGASLPLIVSSFICGFVGYAITEHESNVNTKHSQA